MADKRSGLTFFIAFMNSIIPFWAAYNMAL
jgi:hypothetical protein